VMRWRDWRYWEADFSTVQEPGRYFVSIDGAVPPVTTATFAVAPNVLDGQVVSDLVHYLKSVRCTGIFDAADRNCPVFGSTERVDVHGGWYDASGDTSKYLSHLSYANFLNPQQIPQVVWNLIEGRARLQETDIWMDDRLADEALHGADFLVRMQNPAGFFYMTVFDRWSKDVDERMVCSYTTQEGYRFDTYQSGYRQGGGSTIAALARASTLPRDGEFSREHYLAAAENGFAHLEKHNTEYLDDGTENMIDDYCALLAAVELFAVTGNATYGDAAHLRAAKLVGRQHADGWFWADDAKTRSYVHAAEAGMPYAVLLRYLEVFANSGASAELEAARAAVRRGLAHELDVSAIGDGNPFGYPRQYVLVPGVQDRVQFFMVHKNESGYWWQGENARLGSLACAARWGSHVFADDPQFSAALWRYAQAALDWIFGLNPFDACMMQGHGHNNPRYDLDKWNAPGGVCNGMTAGEFDEDDIDFKQAEETDPSQSWRWTEQWIPHGAWLLAALAHK
ncbi:MAG TPA: glycoside hydrolase family 9 protein, partial [Acidothermaceae bacterium]|nr:glycoside hydrolase family 9 protein [Acidothermaceae bacterium]